MIDPVGAFEKVRDSLLLYIKTAFATRYPGLENERMRLLREVGRLCQEPWIEPLPKFMTSGKTVAELDASDLPGLSPAAADDLKNIARCGLLGDYKLYRHQVEMLTRSLSGQNCVVTAGTGSGKTEAFLLPIFAYLVSESQSWPAPVQPPRHWDDWWRSDPWR